MLRRVFVCLAFVLGLSMFGGCATRAEQSFHDGSERVTADSKAVHLIAVSIRNDYHPSFQPHVLVLHVEKVGATDSSGRFNFTMDDPAKYDEHDTVNGNSYLLRIPLDPGKYTIMGVTAIYRSFLPPVVSSFIAPLQEDLEVKPGGGVFYLGHIDAVVRERQGQEFRAGPMIPLIDQAVSGASGGTFDIAISDAFDKEVPVFKSRFPALKDVTVQRAVLPPFDRDRAQKWWASN